MTNKETRTYDVELGFRETKRNMRRNDPLTRKTHDIALDLAAGFQRQFAGRDQRLVAETMVTAAASLAGFMGDEADRAMMNALAMASVIVDARNKSAPDAAREPVVSQEVVELRAENERLRAGYRKILAELGPDFCGSVFSEAIRIAKEVLAGGGS